MDQREGGGGTEWEAALAGAGGMDFSASAAELGV